MNGAELIVSDFDGTVEALRLLGHPVRLSILHTLTGGERAVGEIAEEIGQSLSLTSQQLALLRKAGLVKSRREAKQVFYEVAGERMNEIATALQGLAGGALPMPSGPRHGDPARVTAAFFARITPRF